MKIYSSDDILILDVEVDDTSYRQRIIKGDNNVTLRYALAGHVEIPVGAYIDFEGERYTLLRPENLKLVHRRNFEYTVLFESPQAKARIWKFRNPVDGRVKFPLTAKPVEHLRMFVDNMNRRDSGWSVGTCIDGVEKLINYDHDYCWDALQKQAETFETEFEIAGKVVSLHRVEKDKSNPLTLCYGCGRGFKPNVGRSNVGDTPPVEILLVQGGSRNIDRSTYGNADLLLPALQTLAYDGEHFEDEEGFVDANARTYIVDEYGLSLRRADRQMTLQTEDSFDCTHIYPSRVGTVSSVVTVDEANNFYDIVDETIPENLNFEECLLGDEPMTLIFQSGMLAGDAKEFEVKYYHTSVNGKAARRFEIVPQEIDGMTMPGGSFVPRVGDTYAVFHCALPAAYVRDDATKSGASWDMFREAVRYMFDHEDVEFSFSGELDGLWAKRDWLNIGGRIRLGGYIQFHDESFQPQGILIRITGIKEYVNDPHSPILTLSNESVGGGFSTEMKRLKGEEVAVEQNHRSALQYTKRRFRDAKETLSMLEAALLSNFTESISPLSVQTMAMLVGDESLQFQFVDSMTHPRVVAHNVVFDTEQQVLTVPAGIIQHMTLGIDTISPDHKVEEYRFWSLPEFRTPPLTDAEKKYYLYAKVSASERTGEFRISETAIPMNAEADAYYLLMGILNSAYDGERSFVTLYGFSEVLPGRITTDRIASSDGESYFDLLNDALKLHDKLQYNVNGDGQLRIVGGISQNSGGFESPIGVYRGVFAKDAVYYNGDRVQYDIGGGLLSTYTYIGTEPSAGHLPTETQYWRVEAAGVKGDTGDPGKDGPYTDFKYAKNTSATQAPALADTDRNPAGWSDVPPALGAGEHLWMTQAEITAGNVLNGTWSAPRRLTGLDGKGIPGDPGKDGRTTYFHIRYADVANPTAEQMKRTPAPYIGTYVDFTEQDSSDPADYTWSRFQGADGIPGTNGEDGKTSYLHIRYSNDGGQTFSSYRGLRKVAYSSLRLLGNGSLRFTDDHVGEVDGNFIGVYVDDNPEDSDDVFRYKWSRLRGEDGQSTFKSIVFKRAAGRPQAPEGGSYAAPVPEGWSDGIPAEDGNPVWMSSRVLTSDGMAPQTNVWTTPCVAADTATIDFEYSAIEENPGNPTDNAGNWHDKADEQDMWMAVRKQSNGVWGAWEVSRIKGENGDWTSYAFKKSDTQPETPVSTNPIPEGWLEAPDSSGVWWMSKAKVDGATGKAGTWSYPVKAVGEDGKNGVPGAPGQDGRTTYFHVRYADVPNPTAGQMKTTPAAYIGTYVDFTAADSDNPDDYRWVRFQGENGRDGIPGTNGEDGKTYYLHIRFSNDGGQTFAADKGLRKVTSGSLRLLGSGGFRFTNHNIGEVEGDYLGYYVDDVEADSPDVFRYSWKRIKGQDGEPGHFIEYRYSKNGSTTVPPELDKALLEPAGWTTAMPTVGPLEYLWLTMAEKTGDRTQLVTPWSTPVRITPQDGKDGKNGESPVVLYRGAYDKDKTYYGNRYRLDAVKYNGTHYITRIDAGEFKGIPPTAENELNADKWNPFGAELESVATNLLLAENASIGDWFISHGMIVSTLQEEGAYRITLDAKNGEITLVSQKTGGEYSLDSDTSNIKLSAASGIIEARNKNGVAYMSASGIFANRAGTQALAPSTGRTWRAAMVGHGFANVNKSDWDIDKLGTMVMGVFGDALNSGTAMAVGGFFDKLYAHGLILHRKAISGEKQTVYLDYHDTMVVGYTSDVATVYLPADPYEGQVVFVKQWWTGSMRFKTRTGHSIYDDNSENDNYDFGCGQGGMFVFTIGYITSGSTQTKKEVWLVSRWKF